MFNRFIIVRIFQLIMLFGSGFLLVGCGSGEAEPQPTTDITRITRLQCEDVLASTRFPITCLEASEDALVVQAPANAQITVRTPNINVTFDSTIYWFVANQQMTVASLDGVIVLGAEGVTRIIQAGSQVSFAVEENTLVAAESPSLPQPYNINALSTVNLANLERPVTLQQPNGVSTVAPSPQSVPNTPLAPSGEGDGCAIPPAWTETYTIQRGDTLTRIANLYDLSVGELQRGNCILNPNRLVPGDSIQVPPRVIPGVGVTATPSIETTQQAIPTGITLPEDVQFNTASANIVAGECTTIEWSAPDVRLVYFEDSPVSRIASEQVCPTTTTTYILRVVFRNGEQIEFPLVIRVETQPSITATP